MNKNLLLNNIKKILNTKISNAVPNFSTDLRDIVFLLPTQFFRDLIKFLMAGIDDLENFRMIWEVANLYWGSNLDKVYQTEKPNINGIPVEFPEYTEDMAALGKYLQSWDFFYRKQVPIAEWQDVLQLGMRILKETLAKESFDFQMHPEFQSLVVLLLNRRHELIAKDEKWYWQFNDGN